MPVQFGFIRRRRGPVGVQLVVALGVLGAVVAMGQYWCFGVR